jgi:hypothetical protein
VITTLIISALATWQAIEIWHHSSLFNPLRARLENYQSRVVELLRCPFCLSPWIALLCVLVLDLGADLETGGHRLTVLLITAPIYALAASRLANVLNDLTAGFNRTPKFNKLGPPLAGDEVVTDEDSQGGNQ